MRKYLLITAVFVIVMVILTACNSGDSIPDEKQIKSDIIGEKVWRKEIKSVEKLEINDTINTKSSDGSLKFDVLLEYTNTDNESFSGGAEIYYRWTDNVGWKIEAVYSYKTN